MSISPCGTAPSGWKRSVLIVSLRDRHADDQAAGLVDVARRALLIALVMNCASASSMNIVRG
jgi:hypothetical protein